MIHLADTLGITADELETRYNARQWRERLLLADLEAAEREALKDPKTKREDQARERKMARARARWLAKLKGEETAEAPGA